MAKLLRLLVALFAVLSLSAALAACGDDDDDASDTTSEDTRDAEEGGEDEGTDDGEEDESAIFCGEGETEVFPASGEASEGAMPVTVTATEYAFAGTEPLSAIGSYAVSFENQGQEIHELVVSRINDDESRSVEELLAAIGEGENPEDFSEDAGSASACPGVTTEVGIDIEEPGRYVFVCTFPVGALPGTDLATVEGPPHAAQGMVQEVIVS